MTAPIDLDHLNRYVFGDTSLRNEVLELFKEQAVTLAASLENTSDEQAWRAAAHTLKGAARGVGAWALGDAAESAEAASTSDDRIKALKTVVDLARAAADYAGEVMRAAA